MGKTSRIILRIEPAQQEQFEAAAKLADKSVSEWLRDLGAAAVQPGPVAIEMVPIDPIPYPAGLSLVQDMSMEEFVAKYPGARISPREIALRIPGVRLGIEAKPPDKVPEENW